MADGIYKYPVMSANIICWPTTRPLSKIMWKWPFFLLVVWLYVLIQPIKKKSKNRKKSDKIGKIGIHFLLDFFRLFGNLLKRSLIGTWDLKREPFGQSGILFIHNLLLPKCLHFDFVSKFVWTCFWNLVWSCQTECCSIKSFFLNAYNFGTRSPT